MSETTPIPSLDFRRFYTAKDTDDFVKALADSSPDLCRLDSLGKSREGRDIPLLTLTDFGSGRPEDRPAYLIHASIHAVELAGTHTALHTTQQLILDHAKSDLLKRITFYIIPRLNPDAAEFSAATSARVRSRTDWTNKEPNTLYQEDMDGDGLILSIRQEHPDGEFVADPADHRLLIRRRAGSKGPFYRVFPEGRIHAWDGSDRIKVGGLHSWFGNDPDKVGGRSFDWNRNWSYNWRTESEQAGAGDFPFSEPEMRHLAEFIHSHPNLFGILGYHTGYASIVRAPAAGSRNDLDEADDLVIEELARMEGQEAAFPVVPLVEMHWANKRDTHRGGHFVDFGYHHLGLFVFDFELGWILTSAGLSTSSFLAMETEAEQEAQMRQMMEWWDRQESCEPLFEQWKPFHHPQLGPVEIGGFLYTHLDNPSLSDLPQIVESAYRFTLKHAQKHPRVVIEALSADALSDRVYRIRACVANRGEFPTHISNKGKSLRRLKTVRVEFYPAEGVELLSAEGHIDIGHLPGITGSRVVEWFVAAPEADRGLCELHVLGGTGGNLRCLVEKDNTNSVTS